MSNGDIERFIENIKLYKIDDTTVPVYRRYIRSIDYSDYSGKSFNRFISDTLFKLSLT